jgi:hypothetical protein
MQKDFPGWHRQKEQLHAQHHTPTFQEREIWWCSVGVNIGHEMDGKNQFYNRPVLMVALHLTVVTSTTVLSGVSGYARDAHVAWGVSSVAAAHETPVVPGSSNNDW